MVYQQQGDVIIEACEPPPNLKRLPHLILAYGEATGHCHEVSGDATLYADAKGDLYLRANAPVEVLHQEHRAQTLKPGSYRIRRVREYDHFEEEARAVQD